MRTAFIQQLAIEARLNPNVFLVVGDLGFSVVEPFAREFPDRFLNAGVAEQNMTGVAAGLASEGYHVFTYSIANFPTLRCLEQIRNDICYHDVPVTIVAVGAGMSYGNLGYSHHAIQDIAIMRALGNLTLFSPADPGETRACVRCLVDKPGPSYLRLGKAGEPDLHSVAGADTGLVAVIPGDSIICLVATGSVLKLAIAAAVELKRRGVNIPVFSMTRLQPVEEKQIMPLRCFRHILAVEEHINQGGLATILLEKLRMTVEIHGFGIDVQNVGMVGSQADLIKKSGISIENIVQLMEEILQHNQNER